MNRRLLLSMLVSGGFAVAGLVHGEDLVKAKDGATHVDAEQAKALLEEKAADAKKKVVVLDVRTPAEFAEGHVKGAKNIDFRSEDFKAGVAKLDRDQAYLVHCRSGGRSSAALAVFKELGFKRVFHLDGGMLGWEKAGNAVVRPK